MADIKLPFRPFFSEPMRSGKKVMTCRSKKMGSPGDQFRIFGCVFELTHVFRSMLGYVVHDAYEQEGCTSEDELAGIWLNIHPVKGYDDEEVVWAHCFKKVGTYID